MKHISIYSYERRIWLILEGKHGIKQSREIIPENKKKLLEYAEYLKATGKSLPRQDKLLRTLYKLATLLGAIPFKKARKKDMIHLLAKVKGTDHTRSDFQNITKLFYAWLYDVEDPRHDGYPKAVSWIRPKQPRSTLKASDLLTPNDVEKLINATMDLRMKALIAVCYECGLRIGEALTLKIANVKLEEQCGSLTVSGKTGPRLAYAIESLPLLMQWLDQHPDRNNPEVWLWTDDTTPLTYDQARQKLSQTRKKAKIHKRVYWHLFRHSSATRNSSLGEPMLRKVYGWSKKSEQPDHYIHLSGEAVKKALLQQHGLKVKTEEPRVIFCPRCRSPNQPTASLCVKCKSFLKVEDVVSIEDKFNQMKTEMKQLNAKIVDLRRALLKERYRPTGVPATESITDEEADQIITAEKKANKILEEHGLLAEK